MKIAFLTHHDPHDRTSWSGALFYMLRALDRHCGDVVPLGPTGRGYYLAGKLCRLGLRVFASQNVDYKRTVALSRAFAGIFERKLARDHFDIIFAPVASTEIAFLNTELPIVRFEDVTAKLFQNYAASLEGLSAWSLAQCEVIETRALEPADRLVYPSQWAVQSAIVDYGVSETKIEVFPLGANLDEIPDRDKVMAIRNNGPGKNCRLLFVGVDWDRKGGDIALARMQELRRRGVNASLTIVGCRPPAHLADPNCHVIPFLDKRKPEDRDQIGTLFLNSDFMVFPTRRDASPLVCCEASAFGLPQIVSDVGGLPVRDGVNGIRLPAAAPAPVYADAMQRLFEDHDQYVSLARSSRDEFESSLNWDAWGRAMDRVFHDVLEKRSGFHQSESVR
jgi:glycosyltransferase involved in cell wall biosynthesis